MGGIPLLSILDMQCLVNPSTVRWDDVLAFELRFSREGHYPDRLVVHRKGTPGWQVGWAGACAGWAGGVTRWGGGGPAVAFWQGHSQLAGSRAVKPQWGECEHLGFQGEQEQQAQQGAARQAGECVATWMARIPRWATEHNCGVLAANRCRLLDLVAEHTGLPGSAGGGIL